LHCSGFLGLLVYRFYAYNILGFRGRQATICDEYMTISVKKRPKYVMGWLWPPNPSGVGFLLFECRTDPGGYAAPRGEIPGYFHLFWTDDSNQVIQNLVDHMLVKDTDISVLQQIKFQ
jgi:hypothetical protein